MRQEWITECGVCGGVEGQRLCPAIGGWTCVTCCDTAHLLPLSCPVACPHRSSLAREVDAAGLLSDGSFLERNLPLLGKIESTLARTSAEDWICDRHIAEALQLVIRGCRSGIRAIGLDPGPPAGRLARAVLDNLPPGHEAEQVIACCLFILQSIEFHAEGTLDGRLYLEFVQTFFAA